MKREVMTADRLKASLTVKDLSNPKNGIHAINIVMDKIRERLRAAYPEVGMEEWRIDPVVSVADNFDKLLFPTDNPGRSSRYTRYVTEDTILRTHTSSGIPSWLKKKSAEKPSDCLVTVPGICYRRDLVDRTHSSELHQMDVWRIKRGDPRLLRADLVQLIETILWAVMPGCRYRANEVKHPYTINGLEVEVLVGNSWLEVLECGEANPEVLRNAGLDPQDYSGLALGMGLDRLVMIIKGIDDIRALRSENPRILEQMKNLDKYLQVSSQPLTKRVLSYSASISQTEEDVCERICDLLGDNAVYLEGIEYSEVDYDALPEKARQNLGISLGQKNVVVTLTFRSLTNSLPKELVNSWIPIIYRSLNEGSKGYL